MPMQPNDDSSRSDKLRQLINGGAEIAGGAIGGAIGLLFGGPVGAAVGGAGGVGAAMTLKYIGQEISDRVLGPREKVRVGGVLAMAASEIQGRIANGESIRSDGFFESQSTGRSDAEEVAESILLRSQREAEERKLPYFASLLANIAFDSGTSAPMAHQLIRAAEDLTYRQLCILRLSVVRDTFGLRTSDYRGQERFDMQLLQILYECMDLYNRGFIGFGGSVAFGPTDVAPGKMTVQGLGASLYELMWLFRIEAKDLMPLATHLR